MSYFVLGILTCVAVAAVIVGCRSCFRLGETGNGGIHKSTPVPEDIADAKLLSYSYTKHGTTRWPLHSERVERCEDDSTRCVIKLFDLSRINNTTMDADGNNGMAFDKNGEPLPDTLIVSADVLDHIKQLIIEAQAWRFKDSYHPREETMDGWSWGFSATFELSPSVLASTPEADRPRLLRRGGRLLSSSGSNAVPDTELFKKVREYLEEIFEKEKDK